MDSREFLSSYAGGTIYGLHFKVKLDFNQSTPGKTIVTWTSYLMCDEDNASNYSAAAELFLEITPIKGTTSATRVEAVPWKENDGYYNFYNLDNQVFKTGTFTITHEVDGSASFGFVLNGNIGGYKKPFIYKDCGTITLNNNLPYTNCTPPTSVSASGIIKPTGSFTVEWSGAKAGISNKIGAYRIYYKIASTRQEPTVTDYSGYKEVSTSNQTSGKVTINLEVSAPRGYVIACGVVALGENYNSNPAIKTGGAVYINQLPSIPTVTSSAYGDHITDYISINGETVTFTFSGGSDPEGKALTYSYTSGSASNTKTDLGAGVKSFSTKIDKNTIFYFWTKDSCGEYCQGYRQINIKLNTKPSMTMSFSGTNLTSTFKVNFVPDASNGKGTNTYSFGYYYNGEKIELIKNTKNTSYTIGDMRTKFKNLDQNTIYQYNFFATRTDELGDTSETVEKSYSFTTPTLSMRSKEYADKILEEKLGDKNLAEKFKDYFSTKVKISLGSVSGATYTPTTTNGATYNSADKVYDTTSFPFGTQLQYINFVGGFSIKSENTLTKINSFNFTPSNGKDSPFELQEFKVYTDSSLNVSFLGNLDPSYGFNGIPKLTININGASLTSNSSGTNDTFSYSFAGETLWTDIFSKLSSKSNQTVSASFNIENVFGDTFTSSNFSLKIIFNGLISPQQCILHTNDKYNKNDIAYKCELKDWKYLKENMTIYADLQTYSIYPVFAQVQVNKQNLGWENLGGLIKLIEPEEEKNSTIPNGYNIAPKFYKNENTEIIKLGQIQEDSNVKFRIVFSAENTNSEEKELYTQDTIIMKSHTDPSGTFRLVSFSEGKLEVVLSINNFENNKLNDGSDLTKLEIYIQERDNCATENYSNPTNKNYTWSNFSQYFQKDGQIFEFLHISPYLTSELSAKLKEDIGGTVSNTYTTIRTSSSSQLSYIVIYDVSPTVAYRKNHIGINTKNLSSISDGVIVISDYGDRKKIYLNSSDHNSTIDLSSGQITNFVIDCGQW